MHGRPAAEGRHYIPVHHPHRGIARPPLTSAERRRAAIASAKRVHFVADF
jgi:hypothetical protein